MKNESLNHVHHTEIADPAHARPTTLIGGGMVGKFVADMLAKLGVIDLTFYDGDFVASHNVTLSSFGIGDVGSYKADVIAAHIKRDTGLCINAHAVMYEGQSLTTPAVVSCVDVMGKKGEKPLRGRRLIWNRVKKNPRVEIFCDTRAAGAYIEVYAVDPSDEEDIKNYEKLLFDDDEGVVQTCGNHGVIYAEMMAAAAVGSNLTRFWKTGTKQWRFAMRCDTLEPV